ncbi:heterokaryon incompatibility protein-domain-containing protein [Bombardia bombarda]|uniref:Heterokaryon incompatibility protein-domain-containing protein n=1 Tax=Bombardia bombarda TaxID=252184 RepID=A0AA39WGE3_9PEZI|nr:heterokaryon incompatibility protein-domain-containing protein [Bombardia bombarda]
MMQSPSSVLLPNHGIKDSQVQAGYCRINGNEYGQLQCKGCDEVCKLMRWGEVQRRRDTDFTGISQSRLIHSNYKELDVCARVAGCDTCQVIRRAFLLDQITGQDMKRLENSDNDHHVYAALEVAASRDRLIVTVQSPHSILFTAMVHLKRSKCSPTTSSPAKRDCRLPVRADFDELRRVIHDCHDNHECSSKFRWSDRNPSWLLEILPNEQVRLVGRPETPVDYVVLSYSWGDPATMPAAEWARIKGAGTKSKDGRPVPERTHPFARWTLPETMQDAIAITEKLNYRYIWIDNVCIPKGTNWDSEASVMHEVYGNAVFTLAASSSTKATDRMLQDRPAWLHRSKACKLRGQWLYNTRMSLTDVRLGSPVSDRGWTLQEERLSPRMLYWTGQRWYWSCPERQVVELSKLGCPGSDADKEAWSLPHRFLEVCRTGDDHQLQEEWLDIVEAYTRRGLAQPKDRFLAIAGLAVRFYDAKAESGKTHVTEEYLAGLWKDHFARHLAWSVATAVNPEHNLHHIAPSWSWGSLPLHVTTKTKHAFKPSEHFKFICVVEPATTSIIKSDGSAPDSRERSQVVEERGRGVKAVEVRGRLRRFIGESSKEVQWAEIEWRRGGRVGFDFQVLPGQQLHSRNFRDGRIVSKEAHGGEMVGQLDYLAVPESDEMKRPGVCLAEGAEMELMCLELGELAMLLLQPVVGCDGRETYRRVGVCIGYKSRKGFFYGCDTRNVILA